MLNLDYITKRNRNFFSKKKFLFTLLFFIFCASTYFFYLPSDSYLRWLACDLTLKLRGEQAGGSCINHWISSSHTTSVDVINLFKRNPSMGLYAIRSRGRKWQESDVHMLCASAINGEITNGGDAAASLLVYCQGYEYSSHPSPDKQKEIRDAFAGLYHSAKDVKVQVKILHNFGFYVNDEQAFSLEKLHNPDSQFLDGVLARLRSKDWFKYEPFPGK